MEAHEATESHEHLEHTAHGSGKRIAILIAVLAALLAIVDSGGKGAQNEQVAANIQASDTWAFYQAKTIRAAVLQSSSSLLDTLGTGTGEQAAKIAALETAWKGELDHLKSDPKGGSGREELMAKAKALEEDRDKAQAAYHNFEYGGAALQLGIVLASASVITSMPALAVIAVGLGTVGTVLGGLGWFAPDLLHGLLHPHHGHEG